MKQFLMIAAVVAFASQTMAECYRNGSSYAPDTEYSTGSSSGTVRKRWEAGDERQVSWESDTQQKSIPHDQDLVLKETLHPKQYLTKYFYEERVLKPSGDQCRIVGKRPIYHPEASCIRERDSRIEERARLRDYEAREKAECDSDISRWRYALSEYQRNPPKLDPPAKPQCVIAEPSRLQAIESEKAVCNTEISSWRSKLADYNSAKPACLASESNRKSLIRSLQASCDSEIAQWRSRLGTVTPPPRPPACMGSDSELGQKKREDTACDTEKRAFIDRFGTYGSSEVPAAPRAPICMSQESYRLAQLKREQEACEPVKRDWEYKMAEYRRNPPKNEPPRPPVCMNRAIDLRSERVYIPHCPDVQHIVNEYGWVSYEETTRNYSAGTQKDLLEDRPIQVSISVSGQVLRPFEADVLSVTVDENAVIQARIHDGRGYIAKNNYDLNFQSTDSRSAAVVAVGKGRRLGFNDGVRPSLSQLLTQEPAVYTRNGEVWVEMTFHTGILDKATDPGMRVKVTYQVQQTDGVGKTTFRNGRSESQEFDISRTGAKVRMNLAGAGRGRTVKAGIWINILDSKWYSEGTMQTEAIETQVP